MFIRSFRTLGPYFTLTALARMSMPRNMRSRASPLNLSSLAAMIGSSWLCGFLLRGGPIEHAHDVGFLHDHQVFAVELDLGARPLREQHAIAALDVERMLLAGLVAGAGTDGEHFAFHRLFLRRVGDKNAAGGLRLRIDTADQNAVLQWTQFHLVVSSDQICRNRFGTVKSRVPARHSGHGSEAGKYNGNQSIYFVLFSQIGRSRAKLFLNFLSAGTSINHRRRSAAPLAAFHLEISVCRGSSS